jgi:acyl transferase domain-containing protein
MAAYPMHANHLYCETDLDSLKPLARAFSLPETANRKIPMLLSASGELLQATLSAELILQSVNALLMRRRDTVQLFEALAASCSREECNLFVSAEDETSRYLATQMKSLNGGGSANIIDICAAISHGRPQQRPAKPSIAIVGMAGRFPEAADTDRLWELLQAGRDVHRTVPLDRFNYASHSDPTGKKRNTSKSAYGCFINEPGLFDPRFFNMSPKEAAQTDPAQRLMILTAYEALEMAGFVSNRTPSSRPDRVATFYGQASDDWRETNSSQDIDTYFIPGGIRAFGPGRINYHLKFSGPSYSVDTACSSSFAAIHMACNSLLAEDCDTAIAGGANILTNPDIFAGLSRGHFLSSSGPCKTFDADADGYCRGDGVGTVVLKRLEDAENDHDNILGVILGVGTNHSADAVSITHPHAPTQTTLYQSILNNNGVDAHDVDYVEMHGTGTAAGEGTYLREGSEYPDAND